MNDDADAGAGLLLPGESATTDERSTMQKRIDDLSAQKATAAKVLEWLEADNSFEAIYGSDSKERHVAGERDRISRLEVQIARYKRSLEGWQLVDTTELGSLLQHGHFGSMCEREEPVQRSPTESPLSRASHPTKKRQEAMSER